MSRFTRKNKILITLITLITSMSMITGCGSEDGQETTKKNTDLTTTETVTTTEEPTTTEQPTTTEEPTTEYKIKGKTVCFELECKDKFDGLVLKKGDKIYLNEVVTKESTDVNRGMTAKSILLAIYTSDKYDNIIKEFYDTYLEDGADSLEISYEQDLCIEYMGDEEIHFAFAKEVEGIEVYDIYVVK